MLEANSEHIYVGPELLLVRFLGPAVFCFAKRFLGRLDF